MVPEFIDIILLHISEMCNKPETNVCLKDCPSMIY